MAAVITEKRCNSYSYVRCRPRRCHEKFGDSATYEVRPRRATIAHFNDSNDVPQNDPLPRAALRVMLRRLGSDDLAAFQAYRHDPVVGQYQSWSATSDEAASTFLSNMRAVSMFVPGEWFQIGIADITTDELIGDIGICVASDQTQAEIGFTLRRSLHGRGLAHEAVREAIALIFEVTSSLRVVAITDARNIAAQHMLTALGMTYIAAYNAEFHGETYVEHTFHLDRHIGLVDH